MNELELIGTVEDFCQILFQNNLFELPVLFYIACLGFYVTASVDIASLVLAWIYVASRLAHAYVHLTHNQLSSRRRVFLFGVVVLFLLWVWFMAGLA